MSDKRQNRIGKARLFSEFEPVTYDCGPRPRPQGRELETNLSYASVVNAKDRTPKRTWVQSLIRKELLVGDNTKDAQIKETTVENAQLHKPPRAQFWRQQPPVGQKRLNRAEAQCQIPEVRHGL